MTKRQTILGSQHSRGTNAVYSIHNCHNLKLHITMIVISCILLSPTKHPTECSPCFLFHQNTPPHFSTKVLVPRPTSKSASHPHVPGLAGQQLMMTLFWEDITMTSLWIFTNPFETYPQVKLNHFPRWGVKLKKCLKKNTYIE